MSVMPTVSSKWNVGFQAQEQLRTVLLTEWKAANVNGMLLLQLSTWCELSLRLRVREILDGDW
jgi:hypothetical protein